MLRPRRGHAPKRKLPTVHAGGPMTSVRAPGKRSKNAVSPPVERTRPLFTSMPMTSSPHPTTKSTSLLRLREFVWVGGCVTAPTAWASPPGRRRRSVHKSMEMASRRRFGAFVYTVATRVAIRIATRAACARWHERLSHHGVPAAPPLWPLPLGRKDRLCASGAAARLASSPRRQPTRTPEEPHCSSCCGTSE